MELFVRLKEREPPDFAMPPETDDVISFPYPAQISCCGVDPVADDAPVLLDPTANEEN